VANGDEALDTQCIAHVSEIPARLVVDEIGLQQTGCGADRPKPSRS